LIGLQAGARAFGDAHADAHGVARLEFGKLALAFYLGGLLGLELTDEIHRNNLFLFFRQPERPTLAAQSIWPLGYALCPQGRNAGANSPCLLTGAGRRSAGSRGLIHARREIVTS